MVFLPLIEPLPGFLVPDDSTALQLLRNNRRIASAAADAYYSRSVSRRGIPHAPHTAMGNEENVAG